MGQPICIHCGAENPYVTQTIHLIETRYITYEEEFNVRTNQCGCWETCEGCSDPDDNRVWMHDGGHGQYDVNPDRSEHLRGTHPVYDYEEDTDQMSCYEQEVTTNETTFRTNCCHIERAHIRELIRMEDGPARFDDGSVSEYSGSSILSKQNVGTDEAGRIVKKDGPAPDGSMDDVLASLVDLP